MKGKQGLSVESAALRRRAGKHLGERQKLRRSPGAPPTTAAEAQKLIHELQVHEIELEMQNDELVQVRGKLEALAAQFTELYDFAPIGYFSLNRDGAIQRSNLGGARLLGVERSRLVNRRLRLFLVESERPAFLEFLRKVFEKNGKECVELRLARSGESMRQLRIEGIASNDGQQCLAVVLDVTEARLAEDEVRRLNAELEHRVAARTADLTLAMADLESFCYSVSHDLRSPARAMAGFARIVANHSGAQLAEEDRQLLLRIAHAGEAMGVMVEGLLDYARISYAKIEALPVDLAALAAEVWEEIGAARAATGKRPAMHIEGNPKAAGDPALLRTLLFNLLDNARKFARSGAASAIWFGCSPEGEFYVRDNGVGFDMAHTGRLFENFQRLHSQTEIEGHGIGLALCRRIVERHGGCIRAEAKPGRGATFYFTLG